MEVKEKGGFGRNTEGRMDESGDKKRIRRSQTQEF